MLFQRTCFYCRQKLPKDEFIEKEVQVYGKIGVFRKRFCNPTHLHSFESFTEELFKRKKACMPCVLK